MQNELFKTEMTADVTLALDNTREWIRTHLPPMEGWCTIEKGIRLAELVAGSGASRIVEIGIFGGRSLFCMGKLCQERGWGKAVGIDPWEKQASLQGSNDPANNDWWDKLDHEAIYRGFVKLVLDHGLTQAVRWWRGYSLDVVKMYADEGVDLLHQDGNHSEEVSLAEAKVWINKVKVGGFWIMDDADWATTRAAQKYLCENGYLKVEDHGSWVVYIRQERLK